NACRFEPLGEASRSVVVLGESLDVVLERVDAGGRDDPGLPHRAAEQMLEPARSRHQLPGAGHERAERAAETLRETERDGVEGTADRHRRHTGRDRSIHEPRAVEVTTQAELP